MVASHHENEPRQGADTTPWLHAALAGAAAGAAAHPVVARARTEHEQQQRSRPKRGAQARQAAADPPPPGSVSGFVLTKLLGQGSFGRVYLCRHAETGMQACVKIEYLTSKMKLSQVAYEHRLYESLCNTGARKYVPRSLCYGEAPDQYRYMVMTLGGPDLTHIVASYTVDEKLRVFANVVRGLRAFHNAGMMHRDIKPRNILIKLGGRKTDILLVDLGLAKRYSQYGVHIANSRKRTAVGTPRYASVNSQMFFENSRRDDLLSCVYTMVTVFGKRLPWETVTGDREAKTRETLRLKRVSHPAAVCRGCPPCVTTIYHQAQQLAFAEKPYYGAYTLLLRDCMSRDNADQDEEQEDDDDQEGDDEEYHKDGRQQEDERNNTK